MRSAHGTRTPHKTKLYVLSGSLVFHSQGDEPVVLEPGDSVHLDGAMPHACIPGQGTSCRCLYVYRDAA